MIFISHSSYDAEFVSELRTQLESFGLKTWVDCRKLIAGQKLAQDIEQAINEASYLIAVISPQTVNSKWVRKEIKHALEKQKQDKAFTIIPLLLPGIKIDALDFWFDEEPLAITLEDKKGALLEALPQILAALGLQAPEKQEKIIELENQPLEELILELEEPEIKTLDDNRQQLIARAELTYQPADPSKREQKSHRFLFTAPIGIIELDELRWYLEQYQIWPAGEFKKRAERIASNLPQWGQALYTAALNHESARQLAQSWRHAEGERRFSVLIDDEALDENSRAQTLQAANALWALPWELLHDGSGYIAEGKQGGRVRRRLPNRKEFDAFSLELPIRVLLVSPRPLDTGYIDHRITAKPLAQALQTLGDLVELTILNPPTLQALQSLLAKQEFHVLHFDGHGVYDLNKGLGGLCFEQAATMPERGKLDLIYADKLAAMLREHRIPLVFLEACQTAQSEGNALKSVAAALLNSGSVSVVAMTHSVLVVSAELFVREFYQHLAQGQRIGEAMLAGQRALMYDKGRFDEGGGEGFFIEDWFVPVLYQEREDPPLFNRLLPQRLQDLQAQQRRLALGDLTAEPPHQFVGRSQQLLALERLLLNASYAVITGQGGAGKTTLAVELARWLVQSRRFKQAVFVCLEHLGEIRAVLDSIGRQLLTDFSVAEHGEDKAFSLVTRALRDFETLLVLDNCESLLPDKDGKPPLAAIDLSEFLSFCQELQQAGAKLLFTSREALPPPFARHTPLGALSESEAIALLKQVLELQQQALPSDVGVKQQWLKNFVKDLNYHARALVLVAPLAAQKGFKTVAEDLAAILAELHQAHPESRELSLYASLELSLRRLSAKNRELIKSLAVFHGGTNIQTLDTVLEIASDDRETIPHLVKELIEVGLAESQKYGYFSLDPALSSYLKLQLPDSEYADFQHRWFAAMQALVDFLYQQRSQDAQLAAQLTLLELFNLLALLTVLPQQCDAEHTADIAGSIEQLFANLQQPQALALAVKIRQQAAANINVWSHHQFGTKHLDIERLLQQGDIQTAYQHTEALLKQALQAGAAAYQRAAYDIAITYALFGRVLKIGGLHEAALKPLQQALQGFQALADENSNQSAAQMVSVTLTEQGDCLTAIGRLDEAVEIYQQGIKLSEKLGDERGLATKKVQLATVRLYQKDYTAALTAYKEAKDLFSQLNEPQAVATTWHQTGMVYKRMQAFEQAEQAYRQGLALRVKHQYKADEAASLTELGNLYAEWGKLEQAVVFFRQAADICTQLGDKRYEGVMRGNLAKSLILLQRYDETRSELQRAIDCKKAFGHNVEPWKTWNILYDLEQATHNPAAAHAAKKQAIQSYLAYRRDGGENMGRSELSKLCQIVLQAIRENNSEALLKDLSGFQNQIDLHDYLKPVIPKLIAILQGERNPALADDPELDYNSAAELLLLLEAL